MHLETRRRAESLSAHPARYDPLTIAAHWLTALLVIALFALAEIWGFLHRGTPLRHAMQSVHVSLGILLAAVFLFRLLWRAAAAPRIAPATPGFQHGVAAMVHGLLYLALGAQIILGFLHRWAEAPAAFFGLFTIPSPFVISRAANRPIGFLHHYDAWLIIILAGGHAVAALLHHYLLRDSVLRRMLPAWGANRSAAR